MQEHAVRSVLLYELNEVPWRIVDLFVAAEPTSNLARLLRIGQSLTTVDADPAHLSPWRTWPTLHRSMHSAAHNCLDLGQDPQTFRGTDVWDVVADAGLRVGLFGPLQSWPARPFPSGGFHVPDTFARSPETVPASLERFQRFNLAMTAENSFSSDAVLPLRDLAGAGLDLLRHGLSPRSARDLVSHLVRERRDPRHKAGRAMMQVLPSFDLYWRLHRRVRPHLSVFFTNHVAAMMHRYWGHAVPEYAGEHGLAVDDVYATFVLAAMRLADRQIGVLLDHVGLHPDRELVVASSMGQGPIVDDLSGEQLLVLDDAGRLGRALGFASAEKRLAMYPMASAGLADADEARSLAAVLGGLRDSAGTPVIEALATGGADVTFNLRMRAGDAERDPVLVRSDTGERVRFADAGIEVKERLGGGNTAYHVPEGVLLRWRPGAEADHSRREVDILDVAPSLLENVWGLQPAATMEGKARADLFA